MKKLGRVGKIGVSGAACFAARLAWMAIHEYGEARSDAPGWVVDRSVYQPATLLAEVGILLFAASVLCWLGLLFARWRSHRH